MNTSKLTNKVATITFVIENFGFHNKDISRTMINILKADFIDFAGLRLSCKQSSITAVQSALLENSTKIEKIEVQGWAVKPKRFRWFYFLLGKIGLLDLRHKIKIGYKDGAYENFVTVKSGQNIMYETNKNSYIMVNCPQLNESTIVTLHIKMQRFDVPDYVTSKIPQY